MIIGVPSGIGDISWVVSKLINAPEWKDGLEIQIADGWPFRAQDYLESVEAKLATPPYGSFRFDDIIVWQKVHPYITWQDIPKDVGKFFIQPNWHLEMGRSLKDWLPDLDTSYHYNINLPELSTKVRSLTMPLSNGNWVGISAASYRGHKAWKTWGLSEWTDFCKMLLAKEYKICLMGGAWDDLTESLYYELPPNACINIVGKTTFPEVCAIHRLLKFYVGFSSGLGIIRSVMNLPTMMIWPEHQQPLSFSWADPEDVESKKYIPSPYMEPRVVFNLFRIQEESWK